MSSGLFSPYPTSHTLLLYSIEIMGWFGNDIDNSDQAQQYNDYNSAPPHKSSISHELISGAAAFEAAKAWENHKASVDGQRPSHAFAKELMAGAAGAFIDKQVETRGLDFIDKERAKREAAKHWEDQSPDDIGADY